jgi:hypothetical protein
MVVLVAAARLLTEHTKLWTFLRGAQMNRMYFEDTKLTVILAIIAFILAFMGN